MRIAVMTDSTAYIPSELMSRHHIYSIPLNVVIGTESYQEGLDIGPEQFYQKIKEKTAYPKTSQPSIGITIAKLKEISKDYDAVICIHLSSGISGTYHTTVAASKEVTGLKVYPFDSEITTIVQGHLVLEAVKRVDEGASPEEVIQYLTELRQKMNAYFMVDDLSHLQRGGRLSSAQAIVGSMLQVKPILHFKDKKIQVYEKVRTRKRAIMRIMNKLYDDAEKGNVDTVLWLHAGDETLIDPLRAEFAKRFPNIKTYAGYFGPVIGTHLGAGAIGVGWYTIS